VELTLFCGAAVATGVVSAVFAVAIAGRPPRNRAIPVDGTAPILTASPPPARDRLPRPVPRTMQVGDGEYEEPVELPEEPPVSADAMEPVPDREQTDEFAPERDVTPKDGSTQPAPPWRASLPPRSAEASPAQQRALDVDAFLGTMVDAYPKVRERPTMEGWRAHVEGNVLLVAMPDRKPQPIAVDWSIHAESDVQTVTAHIRFGDGSVVYLVTAPCVSAHRRLIETIVETGRVAVQQVWVDSKRTWWTLGQDDIGLADDEGRRLQGVLDESPIEWTGSPAQMEVYRRIRRSGTPEMCDEMENWMAKMAGGDRVAVRALLGSNSPAFASAAAAILPTLDGTEMAKLAWYVRICGMHIASPMARGVSKQTPRAVVRLAREVIAASRDPEAATLLLKHIDRMAVIGGLALASCVTEAHMVALCEVAANSRAPTRGLALLPLGALAFDPSVSAPVRARAHVLLVEMSLRDQSRVVRKEAAAIVAEAPEDLLHRVGRAYRRDQSDIVGAGG